MSKTLCTAGCTLMISSVPPAAVTALWAARNERRPELAMYSMSAQSKMMSFFWEVMASMASLNSGAEAVSRRPEISTVILSPLIMLMSIVDKMMNDE